MKLTKISEDLTVSEQLSEADIKHLHAQGYRSILCNRPDEECSELATFSDIKNKADDYGIACRYYPVAPGAITLQDAKGFAELLSELPQPVLAYCRSGKRSISLWALWAKSQYPEQEVIKQLQLFGMEKEAIAALVS